VWQSVLLNMVSGLETPTEGTVSFANGDATDVGFVFQKTAVLPWKTVMQNVELPLELKGVPKEERRKRAQYLINLVGLQGFENALPKTLSGGMNQRVGIARAYSNNPQVLLMDEPFGALDAQTRYQMEEEILRVWEQEKRTVIFVTNNIEEAVYLADRVIVLSKCPTFVKKVYEVTIPRPRDYVDAKFLKIREAIEENTDLAL
jgi:NitT/TauT family transport system ATP-binding protein/sulfonate transport system ATP-binding protein